LTGLLPHNRDSHAVAGPVKTAADIMTTIHWEPPQITRQPLVQPHCHQHSIMGIDTDRKLLEELGCDVEISAGCCGLAGNFGMEKGHYDVSVKIAEDGILQKIADSPDREVLADGFSCQTQITDLDGSSSRHLVQLISDGLKNS